MKTNAFYLDNVQLVFFKVLISLFKKNKFIFAGLCLLGYISTVDALTINKIKPIQVAKNAPLNILPSLKRQAQNPNVHWKKMYGPEWINVDPSNGKISGVTPNIGEAHYIGIRASSGMDVDTMVFILIVGDQKIYRMDGVNGNPSTLEDSHRVMSGGDILIVPVGSYSGKQNTFNGDSSVLIHSGTSSDYTTWIAEYPGRVTLPAMMSKGAEYVAYKGFHFVPSSIGSGVTVSGEAKGGVNSNHVKIMQSSTQDGGFGAILGAKYILFEDVFAYGDSRALFRIGSTGRPSEYVIFRRAVARHDYSTTNQPVAMFMQYGGDNVLFQNCIAIDQANNPANFATVYDHYGAWETKNGKNIYIKDSIAINIREEFHFGDTNTDNVNFLNNVFWDIGTGSTAQSGNTVYENITVGNVKAQNIANTFDDRSNTSTVYFKNSVFHNIEGKGDQSGFRSKKILYKADESSNNLFNPIQADLSIGDATDVITGIDPLDGNPGNGVTSIRYPIRTESGSDLSALGIGATIMYKRGMLGTLWGEAGYDDLSDEPLWPWVNEEEIHNKMAAENVSSGNVRVVGARGFAKMGETLTNYIWGYLGNTVPPFNVQAVAGDGKATIQWDAPAPIALPSITGYNVYDVTGIEKPKIPGGFLTPVARVKGGTNLSATIVGLTNGKKYDFVVTAIDRIKQESSYTYKTSVTPVAK